MFDYQYLVEQRDNVGLTNKDIAIAKGLSESTVSRVLSGTTKDPSFEVVAAISEAVGASLDRVAGHEPLPTSETAADNTTENLGIMRDTLIKTIDRYRATEREKDAAYARHIRTLQTTLIASVALNILQFLVIAGVYVYDITHPDRGWFQYMTQNMSQTSGLSIRDSLHALLYAHRKA